VDKQKFNYCIIIIIIIIIRSSSSSSSSSSSILGRPRLRWMDNIRMNLQEVGCEYMD